MIANKLTLAQDNRILRLGENWGMISPFFSASCLTESEVIGRDLLTLVDGSEVRSFLNALMFSARLRGEPITVSVSCNHPGVLWLGELQVRPEQSGQLALVHQMQSPSFCSGPECRCFWQEEIPDPFLRCGICGFAVHNGSRVPDMIVAHRPGKNVVCTECKQAATKILGTVPAARLASRPSKAFETFIH